MTGFVEDSNGTIVGSTDNVEDSKLKDPETGGTDVSIEPIVGIMGDLESLELEDLNRFWAVSTTVLHTQVNP